MSLKIITGRSRSGKTQLLLNDMSENSGAVYIVPEQFSFSAEKMLIDRFGVCGLGNPQVMSFERLADSIFSKYGGGAFIPDEAAYKMLVSYSTNTLKGERLRLFDGLVKKSELSGAAADLVTTFRKYCITPQMLENAAQKTDDKLLSKKLSDCGVIYRAYIEALKSTGADDRHNALSCAAQLLCKNGENYFEGRNVYIDNFSDFDPAEYELLRVIMTLSPRVCVSLCFDEEEQFKSVFRTYSELIRIAKTCGCEMEGCVSLPESALNVSPMLRHLEKAYFSGGLMRFSGSDGSLRIHCANDKISEIHTVAGEICKLVKDGVRYRDISVVARDIESYKSLIDRIFKRYNIPVFLDRKILLSGHCVTLFLTSVLETVIFGFKYETMFSYIKSPFSPIDPGEADELENYCLAAGISSYGWAKPFTRRYAVYSSDKERQSFITEDDLKHINDLRKRVCAPLELLKKDFDNAKNAAEYTAALFNFMQNSALEKKVRESAKALEKNGENLYALQTVQVYNIIVDILNDICAVIPGGDLSPREFYSIIQSGTDSVEIGTIPSSIDCVNAGSIDRLKGHAAKNVFLIGTNALVFPAAITDSGIFSDNDKEELSSLGIELPPNTLCKAESETLLVYDALTCASDRLFVSYPLTDLSQSVLMPSEIIGRLTEIFPDIEYTSDISDKKELFVPGAKAAAFDKTLFMLREHIVGGAPLPQEVRAAAAYFLRDEKYSAPLRLSLALFHYGNFTKNIDPTLMEMFTKSDMKTSVSRLEAYNKCPFSFYAKYLLKLQPRKIFEVNVSDSGSFLHDFLESFSSFIPTMTDRDNIPYTWKTIDSVFIKEYTPTVLKQVLCGVNEAIFETPRTDALFKRLCAVAQQCALTVWRHIKNSDFVPLGYEISFDDDGTFKPLKLKLPDGKKITLRGRIDRADTIELEMPDKTIGRFARIVDYKSSEKSISLCDVYSGVSLQLFVYLSNLCENGYRPAGILYCTLSDPIVSVSPDATEDEITALRNKKLRMNGIVLEGCDMNEHMGGDKIIASRKVMNEKQFNKMFSHLRRTIIKTADKINGGSFPIQCEEGACTWCDYGALCRFDKSFAGCSIASREKLSDTQVLELLENETEE